MKKAVPFGLFALLFYHTLAYMLVCVSSWCQAEQDLSERLLVYRATDSLIEFQVPLKNKSDEAHTIARTTQEGFNHRGHYYDVVSLEIRNDTLFIAGLEIKRKQHTFGQADLLAFLNNHIEGMADSQKKATKLLKLLLTEYSLTPRAFFCFLTLGYHETGCLPTGQPSLPSRPYPVHSPPPEA
ncbi:hypothetical protein GCM10028818_55810 [Spirosoma horti]